MVKRFNLIVLMIALVLTSCVYPGSVETVYNVDKVSPSDVEREGTVVFVRPTEYSVFGTKSLRDYVEITYEKISRNEANLLQLDLGIRNRGGQRPYDTKGPEFQLSVKTAFYDKPLVAGAAVSAPIYETNWQSIKLLRGATEHYNVICPVKAATHYQVTISELLK